MNGGELGGVCSSEDWICLGLRFYVQFVMDWASHSAFTLGTYG